MFQLLPGHYGLYRQADNVLPGDTANDDANENYSVCEPKSRFGRRVLVEIITCATNRIAANYPFRFSWSESVSSSPKVCLCVEGVEVEP